MNKASSYMRQPSLGLAAALSGLLLLLPACRIEPPLHLPQGDVEMKMPEVEVDINVIWDIDADWTSSWYYGWDEHDIALSGRIAYPEPTGYEGRFYPLGEESPDAPYTTVEKVIIDGSSFRRKMNFGYHDMLFWSQIITDDGTQVVIFDESDFGCIEATTTQSRVGYSIPGSRATGETRNNPEIFYSGLEKGFYLSRNFEDYDYYDTDKGVWVKQLNTDVVPMVYIYLVQVILYNNTQGRVTGLTDYPAMTALADGVTLHTGRTHLADTQVTFPMRFKTGLTAREGRTADILGGKLTTFGLCDMDSWSKSRTPQYVGSRAELRNLLALSLQFANSTDSTYLYDVTPQLQRQVHGGVVTIEIDIDTLKLPTSRNAGSSFNPVVANEEQEEYDFVI